jgi:hypothetical protein
MRALSTALGLRRIQSQYELARGLLPPPQVSLSALCSSSPAGSSRRASTAGARPEALHSPRTRARRPHSDPLDDPPLPRNPNRGATRAVESIRPADSDRGGYEAVEVGALPNVARESFCRSAVSTSLALAASTVGGRCSTRACDEHRHPHVIATPPKASDRVCEPTPEKQPLRGPPAPSRSRQRSGATCQDPLASSHAPPRMLF